MISPGIAMSRRRAHLRAIIVPRVLAAVAEHPGCSFGELIAITGTFHWRNARQARMALQRMMLSEPFGLCQKLDSKGVTRLYPKNG